VFQTETRVVADVCRKYVTIVRGLTFRQEERVISASVAWGLLSESLLMNR